MLFCQKIPGSAVKSRRDRENTFFDSKRVIRECLYRHESWIYFKIKYIESATEQWAYPQFLFSIFSSWNIICVETTQFINSFQYFLNAQKFLSIVALLLSTRVNIDLVELQYIKKRLKSAQRSLGWAVALIQRLLIYTKINLLSHKGTPAQFTELSATECSVPYFGKILQIRLHFRLQFLVWKLTK